MLEIGSLIDGKYKILSEIGRGGMSVVYMAINEKANKTWAIKEVRKDGQVNLESVQQNLTAETDMLKKLKHPHLPSIIDVIEQKEFFIIVMDYIEGVTLEKSLRSYGVQPEEIVIDWAKQLCDVLGYLHTRNPAIIYRDMKPSNVMLKPNGELILIDFGTAREFKNEAKSEDTTCLGTRGYAAPEQFGGQGQTDARTDIYCLGATLYHLVTGYNPGEPPYEMRPIREFNPKFSGGLESIILKCTQNDPSQRYQSCAELMYDLEHYKEIDEQYKSKQKRKFALFVTMFVMFVLSLSLGFIFNIMADTMAVDTYDERIRDAQREPDYEEKISIYEECIALPGKAGDIEAYLGLIDVFREDDIFDLNEQNTITKLIKSNEVLILENPDNYAELCFEMGKLYWYYYNSDSESEKRTGSVPWFEDAVAHFGQDNTNIGMANVYSNIGEFYRDISGNIKEASDKGMYEPFYYNVKELIDNVATDSRESDIVRLELLSLVVSSVEQYATKFKMDGVSEDNLTGMLNDVEKIIATIHTTGDDSTDITARIKNEIIDTLPRSRAKIETAYGTTGGEE